MRIALLHNVRPAELEQGVPDDTFEEFDGEETLHAIAEALGGLGASVVPVEANRDLPARLLRGHYDLAFNIAEGQGRRCREAIPAAICELLELPYTGSDPLTLAATLDKDVAHRLVRPIVPVPEGVVVRNRADEALLERLRYPVLVKPNDEGSSKGIRGNPVAHDVSGAIDRCRWLLTTYGCPARVETFLPGVEVTVGVIEDERGPRVLGLMEIAPSDEQPLDGWVYSLEVKRDWRARVRYHVPPRLPAATLARLEHLALEAWRLLACRDVSRFDFRMDAHGEPHFIECNPLPGLNPVSGDIVLLSRPTLPYAELVQSIAKSAMRRNGLV